LSGADPTFGPSRVDITVIPLWLSGVDAVGCQEHASGFGDQVEHAAAVSAAGD
jgi:hypothetical protein